MSVEPDGSALSDADYRRLASFRHELRVFLRFSEQAAREEGLTPNQHQLLLAVRGSESAPTVGDLAIQLQLKANSTLELVRRAESKGLVSLAVDTHDHRRQLVALTDDGADRLARLARLHRDELRGSRARLAEVLRGLSD